MTVTLQDLQEFEASMICYLNPGFLTSIYLKSLCCILRACTLPPLSVAKSVSRKHLIASCNRVSLMWHPVANYTHKMACASLNPLTIRVCDQAYLLFSSPLNACALLIYRLLRVLLWMSSKIGLAVQSGYI